MQGVSTDVERIVRDAVRHHQAGRLGEAEQLYRQILAIDPQHADSLHLLGLMAYQVGQFDVSVDLLRNAISVRPDTAEYHVTLGAALKAQGKFAQAEASCRRAILLNPDFLNAHNVLGNALYEQGKLDEAGASYRQSIILDPSCVEAHNNLANVLYKQGKLDEAEASCRQALFLRPDFADAHDKLGTLLLAQEKLEEAAASYRLALAFKPDFASARYNLGTVLHRQEKLEEAETNYRQAIDLKPDFADAHANLGNLLYEQGKLDEAAIAYRRTVAIQPGHADALNCLAAVLLAQGHVETALDTIWQSLQIRETRKNKALFADIVNRQRWTSAPGDIRMAMARALTEPWARPDKLAQASATLIKLSPQIGPCVMRAAQAWPEMLSAPSLFGANGIAMLDADPLLHALPSATQNIDIDLERFLTMARRLMLQAATQTSVRDTAPDPGLRFYSALALQCFINEYVFSCTDEEMRAAGHLRDSLAEALQAGEKVPALWLLAVAAYFPLYSLPFAARLLDADWPEPVTAVLVQQIREPAMEAQLRATIPKATHIEDPVSRLVQSQYEENPYPRWVRTAPVGDESTIIEYLCRRFPFAGLQREKENAFSEFLVAGCGTGQQSVDVAQNTRGRVLAVDLSLSSLGYAMRKTLELGLTSIEYSQADILELGALGRSFDVIECTGVLHHLADPFAGWRVLLSLLRPGGLMNLGLYSAVARREVVRTRQFIAEQGYGTTAEEIRRCRQHLLSMKDGEKFGTVLSGDFFGISTCRDLLFHAQEHPLSLAEIDGFLRQNKLKFLGFEIPGDILHAYRKRFPDDPAAANLDHWQAFESDNPSIFFGMYNFWVQKAH